LHGDLCADHILFDPKKRVITGIIDWGDSTIGDPAFDFLGIIDDYDKNFAQQVLTNYLGPIDESFLIRAEFYSNLFPFFARTQWFNNYFNESRFYDYIRSIINPT
jgi:aminoglycoside 2''-phosphotransferase